MFECSRTRDWWDDEPWGWDFSLTKGKLENWESTLKNEGGRHQLGCGGSLWWQGTHKDGLFVEQIRPGPALAGKLDFYLYLASLFQEQNELKRKNAKLTDYYENLRSNVFSIFGSTPNYPDSYLGLLLIWQFNLFLQYFETKIHQIKL